MVADFNKKRNGEFFSENFLFQSLAVFFLIVVIVLIVADFKIYQRKKGLASQINAYQKQITDIKKSSQTLQDEIANADNKDYLEKIAYEQFNESKPGETEYIFVASPEKPKPEAVQTNWFVGVWNWIKSKF